MACLGSIIRRRSDNRLSSTRSSCRRLRRIRTLQGRSLLPYPSLFQGLEADTPRLRWRSAAAWTTTSIQGFPSAWSRQTISGIPSSLPRDLQTRSVNSRELEPLPAPRPRFLVQSRKGTTTFGSHSVLFSIFESRYAGYKRAVL